jgi:hypothetical protein
VALPELREPFDCLFCETVMSRHALPQQRPQQSRNAGILSRRLNASPLRDLLFESHGDIAQSASG